MVEVAMTEQWRELEDCASRVESKWRRDRNVVDMSSAVYYSYAKQRANGSTHDEAMKVVVTYLTI